MWSSYVLLCLALGVSPKFHMTECERRERHRATGVQCALKS